MSKTKPKKPIKRKPGGKAKAKKKYKVRNWKEYNEALVRRGELIFHITEEAIEGWGDGGRSGRRGRPKKFGDAAVETFVSLQQLFRQPLRQAEGMLNAILARLGRGASSPDYSTVSVRCGSLPVRVRAVPPGRGPVHLVVDSTGVKVFGEGEWKVRQHGWSRRRRWLKLHVGVDEATGEVLVGEVTGCGASDGDVLGPLLARLPSGAAVAQVSADGAYDQRKCYDALMKLGPPRVAIPPKRGARVWRHGNGAGDPHPRDANLRRIREVGRAEWKRESGYHRRSLSETCMFRLKTVFGGRVQARLFARQRAQLLLRLKLLNAMTALGMPRSYVAA